MTARGPGTGTECINRALETVTSMYESVREGILTCGLINMFSRWTRSVRIEVLFIMVPFSVNIRELNIFDNETKLTACADDTTIFYQRP